MKGDATANLATTSFCKKEVSEPACLRRVMKKINAVKYGIAYQFCILLIYFLIRCCSSKDEIYSVKVTLHPILN